MRLRYLLQVSFRSVSGLSEFVRPQYQGPRGNVHLVGMPLQLVDIVQTSVHKEWIQVTGFLGEAWDAIAALLGGAELGLEGWLVSGVDDAEVVGHFFMFSDYMLYDRLEYRLHGLRGIDHHHRGCWVGFTSGGLKSKLSRWIHAERQNPRQVPHRL